ncbi:MAG: hypothetical protein P8L85_13220 [Rubripirellula sp.]|nr:hypothetical protein [Rubripirellula sp.]
MLRAFVCCIAFAAAVCPAKSGRADEDRLQTGDPVGVFYVTKAGGAIDDGVEPGQDLCYRCRYGSSPMVMVFLRETDGKVQQLVQRLDATVRRNERSRLRGLVTVLGKGFGGLRETASRVANRGKVIKVPVVVAKEAETGPLNYKLRADAPVTIVVAKDSQVVRVYTSTTADIPVESVIKEAESILE